MRALRGSLCVKSGEVRAVGSKGLTARWLPRCPNPTRTNPTDPSQFHPARDFYSLRSNPTSFIGAPQPDLVEVYAPNYAMPSIFTSAPTLQHDATSASSGQVQLTATGGRPAVVVDFTSDYRALSWALVGGGSTITRGVVCFEIRNSELNIDVEPRELLREKLNELGRRNHVGLLTSAPVSEFGSGRARQQDAEACAIATVGLSNAVRIGQTPGTAVTGTINIVCWVNQPLTPEAEIEALSLVVEARTAKMCDAGLELPQAKPRARVPIAW